MTVHEQFADDLALYALNALDDQAKTALEQHLKDCASCRRELEQLRGNASLLALSTSGPRPPARSKARLMDAIASESRVQAQVQKPRLHWWAALGWLATAAMLVFSVTLWRQNAQLKSTIVKSTEFMEGERIKNAQARQRMEILSASDATPYELLPVSIKNMPPSGKVVYSRERGGLVFLASNLNPLPAGKAYELWLIPAQGAPMPAGVFKPDTHRSAMVVNPPMPSGIEAKAFAITIEPEEGSKVPTMPIRMMSSGG